MRSKILIFTARNLDNNRTDTSQYNARVVCGPICLHLRFHIPVEGSMDHISTSRLKELSERKMEGLISVFFPLCQFIYGVQSYRPLLQHQPA